MAGPADRPTTEPRTRAEKYVCRYIFRGTQNRCEVAPEHPVHIFGQWHGPEEYHAFVPAEAAQGAAPRAEGLATPPAVPLDVLARKIADRMAQSYNLSTTRAADVAKALDEVIDPTGNMLGWLREYARLETGNGEYRKEWPGWFSPDDEKDGGHSER